jgi:hypothetical protein
MKRVHLYCRRRPGRPGHRQLLAQGNENAFAAAGPGKGWRLAVPGRDVMIRDWRGKAEDRHCIDRSPAGQHPIDGDSEGGLRSRAVCMKDPGPDRTARSELDDLRASAVKIGSARVSEYSAGRVGVVLLARPCLRGFALVWA